MGMSYITQYMTKKVEGNYLLSKVFLCLETLWLSLLAWNTISLCYLHLICSFRPPASSSDPGSDLGLILLLLTFSPLLQTGHHFIFVFFLQPGCMLGRWPTGASNSLKPPGRDCDDRNLRDQGVWDRWRRATAEEERQRREQGERKNGGGWGMGEKREGETNLSYMVAASLIMMYFNNIQFQLDHI